MKKYPSSNAFAEDELLRLELQVAQLADQLSQNDGQTRRQDMEYWTEAERAVLAAVFGGPTLAPPA